jgi:serine/threonine protein kinase
MTLPEGAKLGRYEIRSMIGAGGMGEVYLARDPKIGRDVAVKVLPSTLSDDNERLARFEQEAQAAGSLNHPNILAIYDVATEDGTLYVVSELLEGETLRDIIGGAPMPIRKALNFGLQAAHGLAAAHEKGIIHRDLKPENLFVTTDGRLKILDFGLAKLTETNGYDSRSDLPTRKVNTDAGAVMGTVGYMSPEQLRGKPVDQRTDIFSFGTVLYEMLSGQKAFQKDSTADTISAILREDPPELSVTNQNIDLALERVVHRCLEKNREQRFHSASDLAFAIESLSGSQSRVTTSSFDIAATEKRFSSRPAFRHHIGWLIAGLLLISTAAFAYLYLRRPASHVETLRFTVNAPEKTNFAESAAISPNGKAIAFVALDASGATSLWIRWLDSLDSRPLPGTEMASFPFWSPDSRFIGFFAGGKLKKIDSNGGPAQALADASVDPRGGTWSPDGTILFSPTTTSPLLKISAAGGQTAEVTKLDPDLQQSSHRWPQFLPDGKHFIYFGRGSRPDAEGIYVSSIDSMEPKLVVATKTLAGFLPSADGSRDGELIYVRDGTLMSSHFSLSTFTISGDATPIAPGVLAFPSEIGPTAYAAFSSADNGTLIYRLGNSQKTQLTWFDRLGKSQEKVSEPSVFHEPALTPDGKKVVFGKQDGGPPDLFLFDLTRGTSTRLSFDPQADVSAVLSPDGSEIIYSSNRSGQFEFYRKATSGAGSEQLVLPGHSNQFPDSWSKDGKYLIYEVDNGLQYKFDLFILPLVGDPTPFPYLQTPFVEAHAQL